MKLALFRPRQVWLPTLWGSLVLIVVLGALSWWTIVNAYELMAPNQPARGPDGGGAKTLIVEGWLGPEDVRQAAAVLRSGRYERVLTSGGPIDPWVDVGGWRSYALRTAAQLRADPEIKVPVIAVPAPASAQDRSYLSAVMIREWARESKIDLTALDVVSSGVHARRSRMVYRQAFGPGVEVGVLATQPSGYDAQHWWRSSEGVKTTVGEALSLTWTTCCFWPGPRGSHEERWAVPPASGASASPARE